MESDNREHPHVALLAGLGMGHLIPAIELAKRLVGQHGLMVTIFAVTNKANLAEDELLRSATSAWPNLLNIVALTLEAPAPPPEHRPNADVIDFISDMVNGTLPALRSHIATMRLKPTVLIVDVLWTQAVQIANEFNMAKYVFVPSNARFLSYLLYLPHLAGKLVSEKKPLCIPGCEPIQGQDLVELTFRRNGKAREEFVRMGHDIAAFDGILVNTLEELEPKTLASLRDERYLRRMVQTTVYPIGPLVRMNGPTRPKCGLMEWLDCQPDESVIYVSLGSAGTLSPEQTIEMAWGLELSQSRFVWVIRPPKANGTIDLPSAQINDYEDKSISHDNELMMMMSKYLPDGFMDRTRDRGILAPMWAPQEHILPHRAIGGFVSHCGWSSVLESIVSGVPIIAWPLHSEQNMNATMLVNDIKIAIQSKIRPTKGLITREEIQELVTKVMVDKERLEIRNKIKEFKACVTKALDEGGSSFDALYKVAKCCEIKMPDRV